MLPTLCTRFLKLGFGSSLGVERTDGGVKFHLGVPRRHRSFRELFPCRRGQSGRGFPAAIPSLFRGGPFGAPG